MPGLTGWKSIKCSVSETFLNVYVPGAASCAARWNLSALVAIAVSWLRRSLSCSMCDPRALTVSVVSAGGETAELPRSIR